MSFYHQSNSPFNTEQAQRNRDLWARSQAGVATLRHLAGTVEDREDDVYYTAGDRHGSVDSSAVDSGEVQGLDQSIAYARSLATYAGEHGQAGNEGYLAHLNGAKVAGEGLRTAAEMQEAFANAQTAAEAHAAELEKQKQVQEAYDANPDAGDKDFQTEGR